MKDRIVDGALQEFKGNNTIDNNLGLRILDIVEKFKIDDIGDFFHFRIPFEENGIAGFVGYKFEKYVIMTNSNKTLGYERFTLAHELYHLLRRTEVNNDTIVVENDDRENSDEYADMFASMLLMPELKFKKDFESYLVEYKIKNPNANVIISLQQDYGLEYKAITKRLVELDIIEEKIKLELDKITLEDSRLKSLTTKLGYTNEVNEKSNVVKLSKKFLIALSENNKNGELSYERLELILKGCYKTPEDFGYIKDEVLENEDNDFIKELNARLED